MEKAPNQERVFGKSEIIELLKTKGPENPEVMEIITKWTIQQEMIATKDGSVRASILLNIDRSDLYIAIGDIKGALEALEDARLQANQEGEAELYNQIMSKMDEIEG